MSSHLSSESRIYADKARDLNRQVSHFQLYCIMHIIYLIILVIQPFPFDFRCMLVLFTSETIPAAVVNYSVLGSAFIIQIEEAWNAVDFVIKLIQLKHFIGFYLSII